MIMYDGGSRDVADEPLTCTGGWTSAQSVGQDEISRTLAYTNLSGVVALSISDIVYCL